MKKIISILLVMLILVTGVSAGAATPAFLTEIYTNYTADYSISITFDSSEEIVALLEELEMPEEISYYVDMESLLRTLLSYEGKMHLQADISGDYQKIKMALTSESVYNVDVNTNLNVGVNAKMGMWLNMDLSNESAPVFDIEYLHPFLNKYLKIDGGATLAEEGVLDALKAIFDKEYMESMQGIYMDLFTKYATIEGSGNRYTVKMDNEALTSYIDEVLIMMPEIMASMMPDEDYGSYLELPSIKGWHILGEDGLECVYTLNGSKLKAEKMKMDISVDAAQIYTALTGETWEYEADGLIDFTIEVNVDISKIGSTKVEFPTLTEENSFTLLDMGHEYIEDEPYEEDTNTYPYWYVSESCSALPIIDGEIYVPLRQTIQAAYDDNAVIDYNNGRITITSKFFPGYSTLAFDIDSPVAYTDGAQHSILKPVLVDGTTYVSNTFFSDMLGWEFTYAEHNLINDYYHYTFYTTSY